MPAQLTSPCTAPNASSAAATVVCALASSVTSVRTKRTLAPSACANALPSASLRSARTALPPPATTIRAVASPSPEAPPVTMKVLPCNCIAVLSLFRLCLEYRHRRRDETGEIGKIGGHYDGV